MAALPSFLREVSRRQESPGTLTIDLALDFGPFIRMMQEMAEAVHKAEPALRRFALAMTNGANREPYVSGREARMYVRGGLDPAYSSEEQIGALVRDLMTGRADPEDTLMSRANRARLAAAALRGYVNHRWEEEPTAPPIWHRYLARTTVLVTTKKETHA